MIQCTSVQLSGCQNIPNFPTSECYKCKYGNLFSFLEQSLLIDIEATRANLGSFPVTFTNGDAL